MTGSALRIDTGDHGGGQAGLQSDARRNQQAAVRPASAHLIADLELCDLSRFVPDKASLEQLAERVSLELAKAGLTEVGRQYHYFGPSAVTASICLSESHFNFHSWPEYGYVSLDLLCCIGLAAKDGRRDGQAGAAQAAVEKLERLLAVFAGEIFCAASVNHSVVFR